MGFFPLSKIKEFNNNINSTLTTEAAAFIMGARSVVLQVFHPVVAEGVKQHSYFNNYTPSKSRRSIIDSYGINNLTPMEQFKIKRFFGTFDLLFPIAYGGKERARKAAKNLAYLHTKIKGKFSESVGNYKKGDDYSASMIHSILWVGFTLMDGTLLTQELLVDSISDYYNIDRRNKQRNFILNLHKDYFFDAFGIDKNKINNNNNNNNFDVSSYPSNYNDYIKYFSYMCYSGEMEIGLSGIELIKSLIINHKNTFLSKYKIYLLRLLTSYLLPDIIRNKINNKLKHSCPSDKLSYLYFILNMGMLRIILRVLPKQFRLLTEYQLWEYRNNKYKNKTSKYGKDTNVLNDVKNLNFVQRFGNKIGSIILDFGLTN